MENFYSPGTPDLDIFKEEHYVELIQANSGKRLLNYVVDYAIAYLVSRFVIDKLLISPLAAIYSYTGSRVVLYTVSYLVVITWHVIFRTALEGFAGGKSIGKFLTRTRAVNEDGSPITVKTALLRSLSRLVPFEAFSALGASPPTPWHDRWTRTLVIDETQSTLPAN